MTTSTLETLKASVLTESASEMERDPVPAFVAEMCERHAGKPITERHAKMIRERFPGLHVWISKHAGMTTFRWNVLDQGMDALLAAEPAEHAARVALLAAGVGGSESYASLLVDWRVVSVAWPTLAEFKERNTWAYDARDARNAERAQTITTVQGANIERSMREVATLIDALTMAAQEIEGHLAGLPGAVVEKARKMMDEAIAAARKQRAQHAA